MTQKSKETGGLVSIVSYSRPSLMIIVSIISIIISMLSLIFERIKMVGIMSSMGADNKLLGKVFIYQGIDILLSLIHISEPTRP